MYSSKSLSLTFKFIKLFQSKMSHLVKQLRTLALKQHKHTRNVESIKEWRKNRHWKQTSSLQKPFLTIATEGYHEFKDGNNLMSGVMWEWCKTNITMGWSECLQHIKLAQELMGNTFHKELKREMCSTSVSTWIELKSSVCFFQLCCRSKCENTMNWIQTFDWRKGNKDFYRVIKINAFNLLLYSSISLHLYSLF